MVKGSNRSKRIAQEIKRGISIILQRHIKDPRISLITTVSDVNMSCDLAYARVFVTFLNNQETMIKSGIKALQDASGFIRSLLSKEVHLRFLPELTFFYDDSLVEGIRVSNLIDNAVKRDKELRMNG